MRPQVLSHTRHLALRSTSKGTRQCFSSSVASGEKVLARPDWLQRILKDDSDAPKLYRWTTGNLHGKNTHNTVLPDQASNEVSGARVHVLGIGNLGRLFASSLSRLPNKLPVTLILHRKELLEQWNTSPVIEITRNGQIERFLDFDVEWWTEEQPSTGPITEVTAGDGITNLIIATKASDALPQVDRLRRYLNDHSTVAFTQNGMCKMWPPVGDIYNDHRFPGNTNPNWIACVTTHGVVDIGPFRSKHASIAAATIGPVSLNARFGHQAKYLIDLLIQSPSLSARGVTKSELWIVQLEKLVVNSIINPLTAVLRCKNGELFDPPDDGLRVVIDMLIEEASEVLRELLLHPSSADIFRETQEQSETAQHGRDHHRDALEQLSGRFSSQRLHQMVYEVGHKVRDNTSSMLQDVRAGKRTEIRDFNGWLVETARFLDQDMVLLGHERLISMVEDELTLSKSEFVGYFDDLSSEHRTMRHPYPSGAEPVSHK